MFTGKLNNILFDKEGKIECITIQEAYKFYRLPTSSEIEKINIIKQLVQSDTLNYIEHLSTETSYVYRKRIQGDIFSIPNGEIENISITYIEISNFIQSLQKIGKTTISLVLLIITFFCISLIFFDFSFLSFKSFAQKITFILTTILASPMFILLLINIFNLKKLIRKPNAYIKESMNSFLIFILTLIPYVYVFNILSLPLFLTILLVYFIIIANFISSPKEQK